MQTHTAILFYFLIMLRHLAGALSFLIIVRVILSWINPYVSGRFYEIVRRITDPILRPLKLVVVFGGSGLDLSPIIAIILLNLLERWLLILIQKI